MFEHLCTKTEESETGIVDNLREEINNHLKALESEIQRYFLEFSEQEATLVRNRFHVSLDVTDIPDEEKSLSQFWCAMRHLYTKVSMLSFRILMPFAFTYFCESGFSTLLQIKTKAGNKLDVLNDVRLALTKTQPRIITLVKQMQAQSSHE